MKYLHPTEAITQNWASLSLLFTYLARMAVNYKAQLIQLVDRKKALIPTACTEEGIANALKILETMNERITELALRFDEATALAPLAPGKRSFKETLIHLMNIESLNYITIYAAYLIKMPQVYPLHAEKHLSKLNLYSSFSLAELNASFILERKKTLCFLHQLKPADWNRQMIETGKKRSESIYWRTRGLALHDYTHLLILHFQLFGKADI